MGCGDLRDQKTRSLFGTETFLVFPFAKPHQVPQPHMAQQINRLQNAGSGFGARIERGEGYDSFKCRLSAGPPAFRGPLCPLSAHVPNPGDTLESCAMSPSLLPASRTAGLGFSFLSSANSVTTALTICQLPKCCCNHSFFCSLWELSNPFPHTLKHSLTLIPSWALVTESSSLVPPTRPGALLSILLCLQPRKSPLGIEMPLGQVVVSRQWKVVTSVPRV